MTQSLDQISDCMFVVCLQVITDLNVFRLISMLSTLMNDEAAKLHSAHEEPCLVEIQLSSENWSANISYNIGVCVQHQRREGSAWPSEPYMTSLVCQW